MKLNSVKENSVEHIALNRALEEFECVASEIDK